MHLQNVQNVQYHHQQQLVDVVYGELTVVRMVRLLVFHRFWFTHNRHLTTVSLTVTAAIVATIFQDHFHHYG